MATRCTGTVKSIHLPAAFIRDCIESDCDIGIYSRGHLLATEIQINELRNRAEFYAHPDGPDATNDGGRLVRAAKALLTALQRECRT